MDAGFLVVTLLLVCYHKHMIRDTAFYKRIGAIGGRKGTTGGFYANRELAARVGVIGGRTSRRSEASRPLCSRGHKRTPDNLYAGGKCKQCYRSRYYEKKALRHA